MGPGHEDVADRPVRCWASLFTAQAIAYRARFGVPTDGPGMGVVIQRIVPARAAGVLMTLEPVTGDRSQLYLEATYGSVRASCAETWVPIATG